MCERGSTFEENQTPPDRSDERLTELFDVLSDYRRRCVLSCLRSSETPVSLDDLTEEVVRREANASSTPTPEERRHVEISLYHVHLPKLADADLVSFDADRKAVDLRADPDDFPPGLIRWAPEEGTDDGETS